MFDFLKKKDKETQAVSPLEIHAMCDGELVHIEKVNDEVFAQKMMGDGFAIKPSQGQMVSPIAGRIDNVFPTKHAVSFLANGVEVLLHMGIDTVSLEGRPFNILIKEGDQVSGGQSIASVDLDQLRSDDKDDAMIVVFTNGSEVIEHLELRAEGPVQRGEVIGTITLKA